MKRQFLFPTLAEQPYFCFPESVGRYWEEPDHSVQRDVGSLNNFNIHYVASGVGYVELEGKVLTLQKGDAVLYFPLQRQIYYSSEHDPWDVRWFHFYGHKLQDYLLERGFHRSPLWTLRQPASFEQAHLALLEEAMEHKLLRPTKLSILTYAALTEFMSQAVPITSSRSGDAVERVTGLLPLMQSEACSPFILEEWAERAGVSPYYFCKLFRKSMQMTPMDFITLCRLQVSKQWLLERKDATIREIAVQAGYPSVSYFNKRFMEHEGMTPSEYRQLYGKQS
ncbi:helix-turn-helix transcriptional regulator [Paenibacillus hamazuiensis]|uniref:helix-turn-helix transcriptional regulator n=1 Tax=Paenibacillus hamazuiensis TaxID=2936508 RepID=UPI00200C2DCB|nr:AraC family transcriptional regulator [Paenibacillus hamazuiensis]